MFTFWVVFWLVKVGMDDPPLRKQLINLINFTATENKPCLLVGDGTKFKAEEFLGCQGTQGKIKQMQEANVLNINSKQSKSWPLDHGHTQKYNVSV